MKTRPDPPGAERLLRAIMIGIVAWGVIHAFGAWTLNHDARRPLVVIGCVAAFLGFWLALLSSRRRRLASSLASSTGTFPTGMPGSGVAAPSASDE